MSLNPELKKKISELIAQDPVVLFMKGDRQQPQCGFSARVVEILDSLLDHYQTVNVLADPEVREGIKVYSDWPTIPQLYVRGVLVGGCDIVTELHETLELFEVLGLPKPEASQPNIEITPNALQKFKNAMESANDNDVIRLTIDAKNAHSLTFDSQKKSDIAHQQDGVLLVMDPLSASRADGLKIDFLEGPMGRGFEMTNSRVDTH